MVSLRLPQTSSPSNEIWAKNKSIRTTTKDFTLETWYKFPTKYQSKLASWEPPGPFFLPRSNHLEQGALHTWPNSTMERKNYHIWAYLSFIRHKGHEIVFSLEVTFPKKKSWFDIGISFERSELVYSRSCGMNRQQFCRRSSFCIGWMRGTFVSNKSLSLHNPLS